LNELAQSIRANGVVQPIVVRQKDGGYEIVAGERRWRAAQRAGLKQIPAAVKVVSDEKLLELALVENIQRQELNPIEEANAYRRLIDSVGLTQEAVAERVGKERSLIATALRLLKLPPDIQKLIEEEKLSAGHGRALLMVEDASVQKLIAHQIIDGSLSVRETERVIRQASSKRRQTNDNKALSVRKDANITAAETKLRRHFGTNVNIKKNPQGDGGRVEIEFYSEIDLDRIYQLLMPERS
jgi:ParB family chromosome partitioning protein